MAIEAIFKQTADVYKYVPSAASSSGEVVQLDDNRAAVVACDRAAAELGAACVEGVYDFLCVYTTTFTAGGEVWWDVSANVAVPPASAGPDDLYLGRCLTTKASGPTYVRTTLDSPPLPQLQPIIQSRIYEFDCQTGIDADVHILIPASWNKNGLLILGCYGRVSEVFAGGDEDQGVVTIADTALNVLSTLTASDGSDDELYDLIRGTAYVIGATTGDAVLSVAAGVGVTGAVTTPTAGASVAGKMKVRVIAVPLI